MNRLSAFVQSVCTLSLCVLLAASCNVNKKITYFKDVPDSLYQVPKALRGLAYTDPVIQPNDILQISILTLSPEVNTVLAEGNTTTFSIQPGSSSSPVAPTPITGLLVDRDGIVELPVIGKIKVSGLTTAQARDSIHNQVAVYYKHPVVNVRLANFSITVIGEVARPASYVVPNEKVSILDAIGMAGDLTIYGRRENIMLIRDSLGQKQVIRFNLNSTETFSSPYFYLRQGDMVYVEPNKAKVASTDAVKARNIGLIATGLSLLIVIFSRL